MKAWHAAVALVATLATALVVANDRPDESDESPMTLVHGSQDTSGNVRFKLDGTPVTGLYPGATRQIKITVVNPFGFPLSLQTLKGSLVGTNRRACPATRSTLRVAAFSGRLPVTIKPYARATLPGSVSVTMPTDATPKCADTKLLISLIGTGRKAG